MSSPATGFLLDDLPPGCKFNPTDEELVTLYLLPRVRGQADAVPGIIIDDDAAANTQPWKLFRRHGLPDSLPAAFFYVRRANDVPDRSCRGGGTWKTMKTTESEAAGHALLAGGETVKWSRRNLNLNMGSGSVGWVMHEYTITGHPSLKVCSISFTGHGQKRKRVPDGYDDDDDLEPATSQRPRVCVAEYDASGSASQDQAESSSMHHACSGSGQEIVAAVTEAQPSWQFQEPVLQAMEPLPCASPQEPAQVFPAVSQLPSDSWTSTTMVDQDAGPAHDSAVPDLPSVEEMNEFFKDLDQLPIDFEEFYQQFDEGVHQTTTEQLPCASQEHVLQLPFVEDMLPSTVNGGWFCQQFDEQVPARTMEQKVDQYNVVMPSFSGAQGMDSLITATQDDVQWAGYRCDETSNASYLPSNLEHIC